MFSPETSKGSAPSLIPDKTVHFANVTVRGLGSSQRTGGQYAKLELTLVDGPFEGRKVFTIVMDPTDRRNVDEAKRADNKPDGAKMGLTAITRMFEACRVFDAEIPETYKRLDGRDFAGIMQAIEGKTVAVKIKVAKGTDGYEDKNEVSEWLSPNRGSGGYAGWQKLTGGQAATQQARAGAFGAPQQSGFLKSPASVPAAAPAAFPTQQQPAANANARPAWVDEVNNGKAPF